MEWWYYSGSVTTPVDIDGKPTVLRPRMRFQAPRAAVAHLLRIGLVVSCKAPKEVAPPQPKRAQAEQPVVEGDALVVAAVVESAGTEHEAVVSEVEELEATPAETDQAVEEPAVEEKAKAKKSWRKDRSDG